MVFDYDNNLKRYYRQDEPANCIAEEPKPAAGWYRFEKNVLKGGRATEYEIQHFYRITPKWDKKNHFISYKMVEYGHRPTERYKWMDKNKVEIKFPQMV